MHDRSHHRHAGLTQLGRATRLPASPEAAVLETRAEPASRACSISCASPAPNSPRSARSPASPISRISSSTTCPQRLARREQVAEALSRRLPQPRRLPRGLHASASPAGWSRRSAPRWLRIGGYWYPRGGIPIDVFYQTGAPPAGLWLPDQGSRPIAGAAERDAWPTADPRGDPRARRWRCGLRRGRLRRRRMLAAEARAAARRIPRAAAITATWAGSPTPRRGAATRRRCGPRRAASSCSASTTRPATTRWRSLARPDRGAISVYARGRDYHDTVKKRLKALARWIGAALAGASSRSSSTPRR